jgi:hypothetical protein
MMSETETFEFDVVIIAVCVYCLTFDWVCLLWRIVVVCVEDVHELVSLTHHEVDVVIDVRLVREVLWATEGASSGVPEGQESVNHCA